MRQKGNSMNFMNNYNTNPIIIGIDHGYGNIKTAHCCFKTGVAAYDKEPTFKSNLIVYEGRYYLIGEEHKEFISDKMTDNDYYILNGSHRTGLAVCACRYADIHAAYSSRSGNHRG